MLIATTDTIANKEITEVLGLVRGSTVRSKHIGKDIAASFKTVVGVWWKMPKQKVPMPLSACD